MLEQRSSKEEASAKTNSVTDRLQPPHSHLHFSGEQKDQEWIFFPGKKERGESGFSFFVSHHPTLYWTESKCAKPGLAVRVTTSDLPVSASTQKLFYPISLSSVKGRIWDWLHRSGSQPQPYPPHKKAASRIAKENTSVPRFTIPSNMPCATHSMTSTRWTGKGLKAVSSAETAKDWSAFSAFRAQGKQTPQQKHRSKKLHRPCICCFRPKILLALLIFHINNKGYSIST